MSRQLQEIQSSHNFSKPGRRIGTAYVYAYAILLYLMSISNFKPNCFLHFNLWFKICAGGVPGRDSCDGDSGGPLMITYHDKSSEKTTTIQVGIVSFGPRQCGGPCESARSFSYSCKATSVPNLKFFPFSRSSERLHKSDSVSKMDSGQSRRLVQVYFRKFRICQLDEDLSSLHFSSLLVL
jgi:hypothetical protein